MPQTNAKEASMENLGTCTWIRAARGGSLTCDRPATVAFVHHSGMTLPVCDKCAKHTKA